MKCRPIKYHVPKSEWIRIPNKHPAIINKDVFEQVQVIRANSRKNMNRRDYLLSGITACGCCGFALVYGESTTPATYRCMKTHADPAADCHKMKVGADVLESAVMAIIKKQSEVVLACDDLSEFQKVGIDERQKGEFENQISQLASRRQQCYEQFVCGEIDRDTFQSIKSDCTTQIERMNNQLSILKQAEQDKGANKKAATLAQNALNKTATPKDIVNALVEKVLVFPNNHVEIRWKFANFAEGM